MEVPLNYASFWSFIFLSITLLITIPETGSAPASINSSSAPEGTNGTCDFPPKQSQAKEMLESCLAANKPGKVMICRRTQALIRKICLASSQKVLKSKSKHISVSNVGEEAVGLNEFCGSIKQEDFGKVADAEEFEDFFKAFISNTTEGNLSCNKLCKSQDSDSISEACSLFDAGNKVLRKIQKFSKPQILDDSTEQNTPVDSGLNPVPKRSAQAEDEDRKSAVGEEAVNLPKLRNKSGQGISPKSVALDEEANDGTGAVKTDAKTKSKKSQAADENQEIKLVDELPAADAPATDNRKESSDGVNRSGIVKPATLNQGQKSDDTEAEKKNSVLPKSKSPSREGVSDNQIEDQEKPKKQDAPEDKPDKNQNKASHKKTKDKADDDYQPKDLKEKPDDGGEVLEAPQAPQPDKDDNDTEAEDQPPSNQNHKSSLAVSAKSGTKPAEKPEPEESDTGKEPVDPAKKPESAKASPEPPKVSEPGKLPELAEDVIPSKVSKPTPVAKPDNAVIKAPAGNPEEKENPLDEAPLPGMSDEGNIGVGAPSDYEDPIINEKENAKFQPVVDRPSGNRNSNSKLPIPSNPRRVLYSDSERNADDIESSNSSFNYFVVLLGIVGVGFLVFLNKKRFIALLVEGRRPRGSGRTRTQSVSRNRGGSASASTSYRKLENNFDE